MLGSPRLLELSTRENMPSSHLHCFLWSNFEEDLYLSSSEMSLNCRLSPRENARLVFFELWDSPTVTVFVLKEHAFLSLSMSPWRCSFQINLPQSSTITVLHILLGILSLCLLRCQWITALSSLLACLEDAYEDCLLESMPLTIPLVHHCLYLTNHQILYLSLSTPVSPGTAEKIALLALVSHCKPMCTHQLPTASMLLWLPTGYWRRLASICACFVYP